MFDNNKFGNCSPFQISGFCSVLLKILNQTNNLIKEQKNRSALPVNGRDVLKNTLLSAAYMCFVILYCLIHNGVKRFQKVQSGF